MADDLRNSATSEASGEIVVTRTMLGRADHGEGIGSVDLVPRPLPRRKSGALIRGREPGARAEGMATADQVDAFRELRTRLQLMASGVGLSHFTTLVVPLTPDSGASFVARNLAAAFTLQEHHTALLVDCNFRNPTQHDALGSTAEEEGLFDFLERSWQEPALGSPIRILPTLIPGLHIIPAGRWESVVAARKREYFSSVSMRAFMEELRRQPCYTFLDSPPVQGAPDARLLSDYADFVVLVVGYGRSSNDSISEAAGVFDRAKFAGVVFNERGDRGRSKP
jgi:protein-tyrosine kinase